jgi:protein-disulfide isomerase
MHRLLSCLLIVLLLSSFLVAQQKTPPDNTKKAAPPEPTFSARLPTEETVNAFMQQMFGHDPSVSWKVLEIKPAEAEGLAEVTVTVSNAQGKQNQKLYVTADGHHAVVGDIIPFGAHPFDAARDTLQKGITGPALGPADVPVTIVEFSDLQCPYCKQAQPTIDKLLSEEKNARLVFQNFPLPSHNWAAKGSDYADCVAKTSSEAFWKFMHSVYDGQADITAENADEKLTAMAEQAGVKGSEVAKCAATPETAGRVQHSIALGASVDVSSTPTLFINGRKISNVSGVPYDLLKSLVEFAAKQGK